MLKDICIGFFIAIIATALGTMLVTSFFSNLPIQEALLEMYRNHLLSKVMTIGAIANLLVFFGFLKRKQEYKARGVLLATVCIAVGMVILNNL